MQMQCCQRLSMLLRGIILLLKMISLEVNKNCRVVVQHGANCVARRQVYMVFIVYFLDVDLVLIQLPDSPFNPRNKISNFARDVNDHIEYSNGGHLNAKAKCIHVHLLLTCRGFGTCCQRPFTDDDNDDDDGQAKQVRGKLGTCAKDGPQGIDVKYLLHLLISDAQCHCTSDKRLSTVLF